MKETKEQLQAIIDGAPHGMTHIKDDGKYNQSTGCYAKRALSDIRDKLALMNEKCALEAKVADLTSQIENIAEIRAKAVEDFAEWLRATAKDIPLGAEHEGRGPSVYNWQMYYKHIAIAYASNIRNGKE